MIGYSPTKGACSGCGPMQAKARRGPPPRGPSALRAHKAKAPSTLLAIFYLNAHNRMWTAESLRILKMTTPTCMEMEHKRCKSKTLHRTRKLELKTMPRIFIIEPRLKIRRSQSMLLNGSHENEMLLGKHRDRNAFVHAAAEQWHIQFPKGMT